MRILLSMGVNIGKVEIVIFRFVKFVLLRDAPMTNPHRRRRKFNEIVYVSVQFEL